MTLAPAVKPIIVHGQATDEVIISHRDSGRAFTQMIPRFNMATIIVSVASNLCRLTLAALELRFSISASVRPTSVVRASRI